jgi:3-methylfumaryl-CoA hydratase
MSNLVGDDIKTWIGRSDPPLQFEVSRRDIIKYALATEQRNPKFLRGDEAPPMFLFAADRPLVGLDMLGPDGIREDTLLPDLPLKRIMAGGIKHRYHRAITPGDVLTITRRISDIYEKQGSSGPLIFIIYEISVTNAAGELVMQETQTRINR